MKVYNNPREFVVGTRIQVARCPVSRSNETELVPLSAAGLPDQWVKEAAERDVRKKEGWPDFPFFWIKQPNMSSLQQIASRLKDKMYTHLPSGVRGEITPVEKQIIDHVSMLQQHVAEIHDAVQAALQIIDDNRPSQRLKRALGRVKHAGQKLVLKVRNSTTLTILGAVSTLAFVVTGLVYLFHVFRR
jgi:hypothetical protein